MNLKLSSCVHKGTQTDHYIWQSRDVSLQFARSQFMKIWGLQIWNTRLAPIKHTQVNLFLQTSVTSSACHAVGTKVINWAMP